MKKTALTLCALLLMLFGLGTAIYLYNRHYNRPLLINYLLGDYPKKLQKHKAAYHRHVVRILTIDGGGIRGIVPLYQLMYLEQKTGLPISKLFDVVGGTSTGAIIAAGLTAPTKNGKPRFSAKQMLHFYNTHATRIIDAPWYHNALTVNGIFGPQFLLRDLRHIMRHTIGRDLKLHNLLTSVVIFVYSLSDNEIHYFASWHNYGRHIHFYVHQIVTASAASPGFFSPVVLRDQNNNDTVYIDGGISANNPSFETLLLTMKQFPNRKYMLMSVGDGRRTLSLRHYKNETYGLTYWLRELISVMVDAQMMNTDRFIDELIRLSNGRVIHYYRFNPIVVKKCDFFNTSKTCIKLLNKEGKHYVQTHKKQLDALATMLTKTQ